MSDPNTTLYITLITTYIGLTEKPSILILGNAFIFLLFTFKTSNERSIPLDFHKAFLLLCAFALSRYLLVKVTE